MKAHVIVTLKKDVLDPQGEAIGLALRNQGFSSLQSVRQGRFFEIDIAETNIDKARQAIESICDKMLSNPIIENYKYEII